MSAKDAPKKEMKRINCDFPLLTVQKMEVFRRDKGNLSMRAVIRMIINDFFKDKPLY